MPKVKVHLYLKQFRLKTVSILDRFCFLLSASCLVVHYYWPHPIPHTKRFLKHLNTYVPCPFLHGLSCHPNSCLFFRLPYFGSFDFRLFLFGTASIFHYLSASLTVLPTAPNTWLCHSLRLFLGFYSSLMSTIISCFL